MKKNNTFLIFFLFCVALNTGCINEKEKKEYDKLLKQKDSIYAKRVVTITKFSNNEMTKEQFIKEMHDLTKAKQQNDSVFKAFSKQYQK